MKQAWKKYLLYGSVIIGGGILLFILIETIRLGNTGFATKTLWDWMELLVIPLVLAIGAFYLQSSERAIERKAADDRARREQIAAEDRAKLERELATDRQQEAALQAYLDRMAELVLKEKLLESDNEKALNVARVRTLTVMRGLNAARNAIVLRFLHDIGLAGNIDSKLFLRANLTGVDLEHVDLAETNLEGAHLEGANMRNSYLIGANLRLANLKGANLQGARLQSTNLQNTYLVDANLQDVNLQGAILRDANLQGANLRHARTSDAQLATAQPLKGTTMPDGTKHD